MSADVVPVDPQNDNAPQRASFGTPVASLFFWRCPVCGRREPFGEAELQDFARQGWPICCGQVVLSYPTAIESRRRVEGECRDARGE
jgi:hypothetical protein